MTDKKEAKYWEKHCHSCNEIKPNHKQSCRYFVEDRDTEDDNREKSCSANKLARRKE